MKKFFKTMGITALFMVFIMVFTSCGSGEKNAGSSSPPAYGGDAGGAPARNPSPASPPLMTDALTDDGYAYEARDIGGTPANNSEAPLEDAFLRYPSLSEEAEWDVAPNWDAEPASAEEYLSFDENADKDVSKEPLLTFSLKMDTASYRNVVRYINSGNMPPSDAVRIEEMINYFNYDTPMEESVGSPFSIYTEIGPSPFKQNREIAFVRVKSKDIDRSNLPGSNLTFLIDTSGSMNTYDKLPLLKSAFGLLVENLTERDTVSIVTYAGNAGVVLDSVNGTRKNDILKAIDNLSAGGSTAGAAGINTAYALAEKNYDPNANNRVILATDGDFNVGVSSVKDLENLISDKRSSGIYMTVLGFGTENLKDNRMETLAKNGNGNYSYIDSVSGAKKVLVDELSANLYTIADDVKAQIEFNPAQVSSYRLIGYENRIMSNRDFNDDTKDAGEIGVGTDVVLMFELTRANGEPENSDYADELFEVRIRYKDPGQSESKLITHPLKAERYSDFNSNDFNFAVSVAAFGHLLKASPHTGDANAGRVLASAKDSAGVDNGGYREEFIEIVQQYISLGGR